MYDSIKMGVTKHSKIKMTGTIASNHIQSNDDAIETNVSEETYENDILINDIKEYNAHVNDKVKMRSNIFTDNIMLNVSDQKMVCVETKDHFIELEQTVGILVYILN